MKELEPIQQLFSQLTEELTNNPKSSKIRELLQNYISNNEDWREYAMFSPDWYARNCVNRNSTLELLIICWGEGQKSYCHNHPSSCWLSVLEGDIKETRYRYEDTKQTVGNSPLVEEEVTVLKSPDVGYIDDGIALHILGSHGNKKAVSLHIYSPPVEECNIYDVETGAPSTRKLCYFSFKKEKCLKKCAN